MAIRAATTYGAGGLDTSVYGPEGFGSFSTGDLGTLDETQGLMGQLLRQKLRKALARPEIEARGARAVRTQARGTSTDEAEGELRNLQKELVTEGLREAQGRRRAMSMRQPLRSVTVGGQSFMTPETLGLTGYEREVFLPKAAGFERGGLSPSEEMAQIVASGGRRQPAEPALAGGGGRRNIEFYEGPQGIGGQARLIHEAAVQRELEAMRPAGVSGTGGFNPRDTRQLKPRAVGRA